MKLRENEKQKNKEAIRTKLEINRQQRNERPILPQPYYIMFINKHDRTIEKMFETNIVQIYSK